MGPSPKRSADHQASVSAASGVPTIAESHGAERVRTRFDPVRSGRVPLTLGAHASARALRVPSNPVSHTTQSDSK
jgi:hypothetical protein